MDKALACEPGGQWCESQLSQVKSFCLSDASDLEIINTRKLLIEDRAYTYCEICSTPSQGSVSIRHQGEPQEDISILYVKYKCIINFCMKWKKE